MTDRPAEVPYDRRDQLAKIEEALLEGESVVACYDGTGQGTGFIGLTSHRVILQDKSFVGKRVALTSIPYSRISAVSIITNASLAGAFFSSGTVAIVVGTHIYEIEMRGVEKARHVHDVVLWSLGIR
ncbi:MAG TPA: PH domain-containing protein [Dermatophilaceae bacterium]|nr:PH domain-containing protein [Dermatophilaceae bacterium]